MTNQTLTRKELKDLVEAAGLKVTDADIDWAVGRGSKSQRDTARPMIAKGKS
jgi:hypothetical protein